MLGEQRGDARLEIVKAPLRGDAGGRADHAAVERDEASPASPHDAEAEVREPRIYAKYDHGT